MYSESHSHTSSMTTQVNARFQQTQMQFGATFADLPVPGIGKSGRDKLVVGNETSKAAKQCGFAGGITNAAQVVGYFLRLNGDRERMRQVLVDQCGCYAPSVDKDTLDALAEKCASFVLPYVDTTSARDGTVAGTTQVMASFMSKQLSWQDTFQSNKVPGLGEAGIKRMKADGITTPAQLVGLYMMLDGDDEDFAWYLREECGIDEKYIRSERTVNGSVMPGVLEAISNKAREICAKAPAPSTPPRSSKTNTSTNSPVFASPGKEAAAGWKETEMRKRSAAAAKAIDSAATETPKQPASEAACPSWLLPALGFAALYTLSSMM